MKTAVVLVGGKGTRLKSLVSDVPKPLAKIAGEPFLFLILRSLADAGIQRVVLLTGYMHEKIVAACGDGQPFGIEIVYSQEQEALGTAGALKNAEIFLQNTSEFLLLNGDTYLDCSLSEMVDYPLEKAVLGAIGVSEPDDTKRYGTISLIENSNHIRSFQEKNTESTGLVSAGIYKFSEKILQFIPKGQFCSLETDIFPELLQKNFQLHAVKLSGAFCDIGIPDSYAAFNVLRIMNSEKLNPVTKKFLTVFLNKGTIWLVGDIDNVLLEKKLQHFNACVKKANSENVDLRTYDLLISEEFLDDADALVLKGDVCLLNQQVFSLHSILEQAKVAWENLQISVTHFSEKECEKVK